MPMKRQRLSAQAWIDAGLSELVAKGPTALAAEPLARELGTTKGSFYWHFKSVPDFHAAVVGHWQALAFQEVVQALQDTVGAEERLRRFGKMIVANAHDPAIRAWARTDNHVAKAMTQVDTERLKYVTNLLNHLGVANEDFARSCLAALIGLPEVSQKKQASKSFETLVDLILALK